MEKRSRQRVQVAHMAFGAESRMRSSARGYPSWPGTQTFRSRAGYGSARPTTSRSSLSACNARPVHTEGPFPDSCGTVRPSAFAVLRLMRYSISASLGRGGLLGISAFEFAITGLLNTPLASFCPVPNKPLQEPYPDPRAWRGKLRRCRRPKASCLIRRSCPFLGAFLTKRLHHCHRPCGHPPKRWRSQELFLNVPSRANVIP
jgi:hypothetical protein